MDPASLNYTCTSSSYYKYIIIPLIKLNYNSVNRYYRLSCCHSAIHFNVTFFVLDTLTVSPATETVRGTSAEKNTLDGEKNSVSV